MAYLGPSLRREKRAERPMRRALAALAASVALNVALLWGLALSGAFRLEPAPDSARVALARIDSAQWEANRAVAAPDAPRPKPNEAAPPVPKEEERDARGQVVDVTPSEDSRRPKDSRFLAEHDSTVERETKSRFANRKRYESTLPAPQEGAPGTAARPRSGEAGPAQPGKPGPSGSGQAEQERLALAPRPDPEGRGDLVRPRPDRDVRPRPAPGGHGPDRGAGEGGREGDGIDRRLLPDAESLARIAGGPSLDRLDDVEEGDATALNTREFKYAGFINRVNKAVQQYWDPGRAYMARDPDGTMYALKERTTVFELVLEPDGALEAVHILEKSGLDFLDLEAVRAARAAAPFPNPPQGLLSPDGKVHLALIYTLNVTRKQARIQVIGPTDPLRHAYPERDPAVPSRRALP